MRDSMAGFSYEKRPLKRARLGPPDVYPQDPKQREDELTAVNVKQGFSHIPQLSDEYGSAKINNISAAKIVGFSNGVMAKKQELNTLPDTGKRRLQVNTKDNFWPVTPRHKHLVDSYMKELSSGKQLSSLSKKVPIFNKREEIFLTLAEHSVPNIRAAWFLKMTACYNSAISESKTKKRQMPDPTQEWTASLLRCLKDILLRLTDWYNGGTGNLSSLNSGINTNPGSNSSVTATGGGSTNYMSGNSSSTGTPSTGGVAPTAGSPSAEDGNVYLKQWQYCTELTKYLYEEGLLDRYDWLQWIIEACDRMKSLEDGGWKGLVPVLLAFIPDIAQSELLARRLSHLACRRLSTLFLEMEIPANFNAPIQPPATLLENLHCSFHRGTILALVCALQVIVIECPTALVFNANNFSLLTSSPNATSNPNALENSIKSTSTIPLGSPLDLLPIPPSALPMPPRANNPIIRLQLRAIEEQVRVRSKAVEAKWACEEWQQSSAGVTLQKVLAALEALDSYSFDKVENSNCLETLYAKMFANTPICKENPVENDAPIVLLLCQWAVGSHRSGDHRALVVARLLEQRQNMVTSSTDVISTNTENQQAASNSTISNNEGSIKSEKADNCVINDDEANQEDGNTTNQASSNTDSTGNSAAKTENEEDKTYSGLPIYHNLLFKYLDTDAPTLDDSTTSSKVKFTSLVHLFSALIRHDIFSHDTYLCTLVARGEFSAYSTSGVNCSVVGNSGSGTTGSFQQLQAVTTPGGGGGPGSHAPCTPASVSSTVTPSATPLHDFMDEMRGSGSVGNGPLFQPLPKLQDGHNRQEYDDKIENIDDDLDRILRHITQEQQENMDQVDSPKDEMLSSGGTTGFSIQSGHQITNNNSNSQPDSTPRGAGTGGVPTSSNQDHRYQSRHRIYVTHFPLPQDDSYAHEANQRHVLLYGVGRQRDESRYSVKKIAKDLSKLFTKKFCYDIADGSRVKKHSKNEISLENLQSKFIGLPYFDQNYLTSITASTVLEMLTSFGAGRSSCLPTVEHITFLTELMEVGLNVVGIIETGVQILRDLPDIEAQLVQRNSPIVSQYTTQLLIQVIGILRRYHSSLLLDVELVSEAWEALIRILRRFTNPLDCTSAERCTLAYLTDLHGSCNFLRTKNFNDILTPIASKLRNSLCADVEPNVQSTFGFNNSFMTQCLDNPRRKVDPLTIRQLNENGTCRYSFVCNSILSICNEADSERLNDLASLCAEMTAVCPALASEWLGALQSLCSPSRHVTAYSEILEEVDVKHLTIHSSLATLTAMLVARQCFKLQDIVVQAVPSLLKAWNENRGPRDTDTEAGARLTCYLLLSLFKTQDSMNPITSPQQSILRNSSDRRLLSATHCSITLGAVLAALKAMLLLADAAVTNERRREQRPGMSSAELSISHILGTSDVLPLERNDSIRSEPRTLASFALNALQQMCAEPWVRERCLRNPMELCQDGMLLDNVMSPRQAQRLLHLICYPELVIPDETLEHPRAQMPRIIMERLDQWNIREAWVALTLQNKQLVNNSSEYQGWLDTVARSALEVFHLGEEAGQEYLVPQVATSSPAPGKSPRSGKKGGGSHDLIPKTPPSSQTIKLTTIERKEKDGRGISATSAWLIAPLVEKLSPQVQGRVLRHAGNVLESTLWPKTIPKKGIGCGLYSHLPFLALILTCLKGQDEQRETLLQSLLAQFSQLLQLSKDTDTEGKAEILRDALRLRLSLVGGMFDAIQKSVQGTAEWAVTLTQLVTHSVVDLNTNSDVFYTVVDMVTALVHSTQVIETGERIEEVRKQNANLIKKLKKELTDRNCESMKPLRQLLPFSRVFCEIIVTQSTSTITDSKGNRVQSFDYVDKKPGLQVWEKQRLSPWELLEGQKNPAPLSWAYFGAVKMERKTLRYEEGRRLNRFHTHSLVKPFTHFLEPVPLPPEEIDIKPEIHIKEEINLKPDTPISILSDQSPRGPVSKPAKVKPPRKKRLTKAQQEQQKIAQAAAAAAAAAQHQAQVQPQQPPASSAPQQPMNVAVQGQNPMPSQMGFGGQNVSMPGGVGQAPPPNYQGGPPSQWYNGQQQQPQQSMPPQQYYQQQQQGGARMNQSPKVALHNLLRARTVPPGPGVQPGQFQQFQQGPNTSGSGGGGPRHGPILRQQLRGQPSQPPQSQPSSQPNQIQGQGFPQNQNSILQVNQPPNQNFVGYNNQGVMGGMNSNVGGGGAVVGTSQQNVMLNSQQSQQSVANMQMQMSGPRGGGNQEMNFMGNRPQMGVPRAGGGNIQFQQGQGMGTPMQNSYVRPMSQVGQMGGGQMIQGQMGGMQQNQMNNMGGGGMTGPSVQQLNQGVMGQQRMLVRQQMMMQQQQMGMRGPPPSQIQQQHFNPNQGGYG